MRRFLVFSGGLLACLIVLSIPRHAATSQKPRAKSADTIVAVHVEHCRIKFIQRATLASGQIGILKFVRPQEGDPVQKDQPVAALKDDVQRARVAVADYEAKNNIDILYAKKAVELAKTEVLKAETVNRDVEGTVPDIEVLRLKLAADRGVLQVGLAEHEAEVKSLNLRLAQSELSSFEVKSPFDGIVTQVFKHAGEAVRQGDPILEIVNPDRIRAEGYVSLKDAWRIKKGNRVVVGIDPSLAKFVKTKDGKPVTFEGKVVFIDVNADPVTGKVRIWAEVKNRDGILRSGLAANMQILSTIRQRKTD